MSISRVYHPKNWRAEQETKRNSKGAIKDSGGA